MDLLAMEIINKTKEMLNSKKFKEENRTNEKLFTRNRKMNFKSIMLFCLNFIKKSLQIELDDYMELLNCEMCSTISKQGFSKARQNILPEAFEQLFLMTSDILLNNHNVKKLKGYRIFAIDGMEMELPKSKELYDHFEPKRWEKISPRARASTLYDCLNGFIIHANIQNQDIGERILALNHLEYFKEVNIYSKKNLIIFDRGYPSKDLIKYLENNNFKYLMRLQKNFNPEIDSRKNFDFYIKLVKNRDFFNVRVIKLILPNGEEEVLITNLSRKTFKKSEFEKLYFLRWGIEVKYNTFKNKLLLEEFSSKIRFSILQEFYITMYLANLIETVKIETNKKITKEDSFKHLKNEYKTNESLLIGTLKNKLVMLLLNENPIKSEHLFNKLIFRISNFKIAVIPDRHFERPKGLAPFNPKKITIIKIGTNLFKIKCSKVNKYVSQQFID